MTGDLTMGTMLDGRFVVRRRLGAGGFGTVYLVDQQVLDVTLRRVALKVFHPGLVTESNASEQLNDAAVLMRLHEEKDHPEAIRHLVTVLDAGFLHDRDSQAFVAMEYVPGYPLAGGGTARTLRDMIEVFRPVPVDLVLRWTTQILRAVGWMHTREPPVLHCDIKSDNVLPDGPETLKVADFGLAQVAVGAVGLWGGVGAQTCQSPESLAGVEPTPASDVYAIGLLMYEMLAGRDPLADVALAEIAADDPAGCIKRHLEARRAGLPPLTEADNADLVEHPVLTDIVAKCLRFRAVDRYPNAAMLLAELEAYTAGKAVTVSRPVNGVDDDLRRRLGEAESLFRRGEHAAARERGEAALARHPTVVAPYAWVARMSLSPSGWRVAVRLCGEAQALPSCTAADRIELLELSAAAYEVGGQSVLADRLRARAVAMRAGRRR